MYIITKDSELALNDRLTTFRHHAARVSGIGHNQLLSSDQSYNSRGAAVWARLQIHKCHRCKTSFQTHLQHWLCKAPRQLCSDYCNSLRQSSKIKKVNSNFFSNRREKLLPISQDPKTKYYAPTLLLHDTCYIKVYSSHFASLALETSQLQVSLIFLSTHLLLSIHTR